MTKNSGASATTIASRALPDKHPELFHYTKEPGFLGIMASQTLWATHFKNLNDTTEVQLLRKPLQAALALRFAANLEERQKRSMTFSARVFGHGGREVVAAGLAESLVSALYKVTYGHHTKLQFGAPYVTSFTTHSKNYEKNHGLLSQWRDYGKEGYCLVFDTAALSKMLWIDFDKAYFVHLNMDEAIYAVEDFDIEEKFGALLRQCERYVGEVLNDNQTPDMIEDGFAPFAAATTMFKHQGFREENEVRIVAIPGTQYLSDRTKAEFSAFVEKPIVESHKTASADGKVIRKHIALFSRTDERLPIARIIVGPGPDQEARFQKAKSLTDDSIMVTRSGIPWTG
ncbi:MAG: DUF2971 domain-containing protein [Bradyrhizobium sp.]